MNTITCPHCGELHPANVRFCPNTAQPIARISVCPRCGVPVEENWKVCAACGQRLGNIVGSTPKPSQTSRWLIGAVVAIGLLIVGYRLGKTFPKNTCSEAAITTTISPPVITPLPVPPETPVLLPCNQQVQLLALAQAEGELTVIALPHDWASYGEIIETYKTKYNMKVNELNPSAGSMDELEAIRANKDSKGPLAPDVIDIGWRYTRTAMEEGLVAPYKVADWESIPITAKDPDGYYWGNYFGVLAFEVNADLIKPIPEDWEDLLKPEYRGKVALAGDVMKSNQAVMTVMAAGLSGTGGDIETAPDAGLQFWKEMKDGGNFISLMADRNTIISGETPITIEWDYLALANRDALAGNPHLEVVIPRTGVLGGPYAAAISAYAPNPAAARLWSEFLMSDEGQILFLKGYAHPIRYLDLVSRNVIPENLAAKLPTAERYKNVIFLTVDQLVEATTYIRENWSSVVGY